MSEVEAVKENNYHTFQMMVNGLELVEQPSMITGETPSYFEVRATHAASGTEMTIRTTDFEAARLFMIGDLIDVTVSEPYEYSEPSSEV
jgi:hypothetical protein